MNEFIKKFRKLKKDKESFDVVKGYFKNHPRASDFGNAISVMDEKICKLSSEIEKMSKREGWVYE